MMKKLRAYMFKLKLATEKGYLFKLRCRVLQILFMLANIDLLRLVWRLKKAKVLPQASQKFVAIFSMYRPIFWHSNIFEMQMNKALVRKGYQPVHLLCRGFLEVCDSQYYGSNKHNNPALCQDCRLRNTLFYARNNAATLDLDQYLNVSMIKEALAA